MPLVFEKISLVTGWQRFTLAVLAGLLLALGQAPLSLPWGIFPAFALIALLITKTSKAQGFATLWCVGAAYFAASLTWIVEPFLVDFARHGWMAPFALLFLAGGLALFWGVAGWIAALVQGRMPRAVLLVAALGAAEFARANVLTGFPWGLLAYHWIDTPIAQVLSTLGPHGLGVLGALFGVALVFYWPWGLLVSASATATLWIAISAMIPPQSEPENPLIVRLIQPNAAQHLKWKPENLQLFFDRQIDLTQSAGPRDVVIWPETAVPFLLGDRPDLQEQVGAAAGVPVILGARRNETRDSATTWFNSLGLITPDGALSATYDKHHLVPFGEYLPFKSLMDRLGLTGLAQGVGGFGAGAGPRILQSETLPPFLPLICYEAIFPNALNPNGTRAEWLLHITNDAWFGTYSGPYQHLAQARARAIEQGLPLARAANTGISAMIDPWGRITASMPLGEAGFIDAALPSARPITIYAKFGDAAFWLACLSLILVTWRTRRISVASHPS